MTFRVALPWPAKELNPNSRCGWRRKAEAVQLARNVAYFLARSRYDGHTYLDDRELQLRVVAYPPDKRRRDADNILASEKAHIDGVCQALQIDDHSIRRTVIEWGDVKKGGEIVMELEPIEDNLNGGKE